MTKEELRSLTIEQLNEMTEEQLDVTANQVVKILSKNEIKQLSKEVRDKLKISRGGGLGSWVTWIALIVAAFIMGLIQLIKGK